MNLSLIDTGGAALVVSQFTLWGGLPEGEEAFIYPRCPARESRGAL